MDKLGFLQFPRHQHWIIKAMKALGYPSNKRGVCFGIARMGMQAIFSSDLETFDKRFVPIYKIPLDKLPGVIQKRRLESIGRKPTEDEYRILEIPAFFEGVELYHHPYYYPDFFDKKSKPKGQDAALTAPLVLSKKLEHGKINITKIGDDFSGVYSVNELTSYFDSFSKIIQTSPIPIRQPIAFFFEDSNHAITVGYNPIESQWLLIDANQLPTQRILNAKEIANCVISAFSKNGIAALCTEIYGVQQNEKVLNGCVASWKNQENWKMIHMVSKEKSQLADSNNANWLFMAAEKGHIDKVIALIENESDIDQALKDSGMTPLYVAAKNNHLDIVKLLLKKGATVDKSCTDDGSTPLYVAAQNGNLDIVKVLLENGANIDNACTDDGSTPIYEAAKNNHLDVVTLLIEKGAAVDKPCTDDNSTPLYAAVQNGNFDIVKMLLENGAKANINNACTDDGSTLLYEAAQNGCSDIVELLIKEGAATDKANFDGNNSLFIAVSKGHIDVVRILLENYSDPDIVNNESVTSLYVAVQNNQLDIVKELLSAGADPNVADREGKTPLFIAAKNGYYDIAQALLGHGAKVDTACKDDGATPLFIATQEGHLDLVRILLERGADPDQFCTDDNATPLFVAAQKGNISAIEFLLRYDADVSIAFKTNADSLRDFAKEYHVEERMNSVITSKSDPFNIELIPEEIAYIMGHDEIADRLKSALPSKSLGVLSR